MIQTTISSAKAKLSYFIELAKNGETVLITDRGVPVVKLESAARQEGGGEATERLYRLERAGILSVAERPPLEASFFRRPLPCPKDGASGLRALLDEREEAR